MLGSNIKEINDSLYEQIISYNLLVSQTKSTLRELKAVQTGTKIS